MRYIDLYLDLDGVILRRTGSSEFNGRVVFDVAPGAFEFLKWATENFHCYWLTSRSHSFDAAMSARYTERLAAGRGAVAVHYQKSNAKL